MDGKRVLNAAGIRATNRNGWNAYVRRLVVIMGGQKPKRAAHVETPESRVVRGQSRISETLERNHEH
jgi:hypothetical protein